MPVLPASLALPLDVPASLATEMIGGTFAASLQPGEPQSLDAIAGFVLVRLLDGRFVAEATYNGAERYVDATWDCAQARRADPAGPWRRVITVYRDGTYD